MGQNSSIEWTTHTFNPWWGCAKVSPGCEHCYAETLSKRTGHAIWGPAKTTPRRKLSEANWRKPVAWNAAAEAAGERARVFCASMADVFEEHPDVVEERARLFDLIRATPHLDWQLLTKRPENVLRMVPAGWRDGFPANVWIGTSVEDQRRADERIPELLRIPARIRFLSCEPLLGPVDLTRIGNWRDEPLSALEEIVGRIERPRLDWVIVGGESGPGARPMDLIWAWSLVDQCRDAGVAVFVKQLGARLLLRDPKGGDMTEWPANLRVRQMPEPAPA